MHFSAGGVLFYLATHSGFCWHDALLGAANASVTAGVFW